MMNLLNPILKNKMDSILELQIYMENIEDAYERYDNAILDVFDSSSKSSLLASLRFSWTLFPSRPTVLEPIIDAWANWE